jgi:hypothetical protein
LKFTASNIYIDKCKAKNLAIGSERIDSRAINIGKKLRMAMFRDRKKILRSFSERISHGFHDHNE